MQIARRLCLIALFILGMELSPEVHASDDDSHAPITSPEELDARLLTILEETGLPGMIGTIVYGDEVIWHGALGSANTETGQPVTKDTLFRVGSISKSIVSLAVLKLVERGQLSLDTPISELAPETGINNPWEETDPVRLVHTLEHTAGFDDIHFRDYAFSDPDITNIEGIQFNNGSRDVRWRPGTRMAYSNIGPPIAAVALENVTGITFEAFADREIFEPLGMHSATFFYDEAVAASYRANGEPSPYIHIPVRPSGSMNATSADMAQLLKMFIARGSLGDEQIIQPASLTRMETPMTTVAARAGLKAGYGLSNFTSVRNGFVFHGHTGGIDGFVSNYAYLPEAGRGFFYSLNQPNREALRQIRDVLVDYVTQDLQPPPKTPQKSETNLSGFEGLYQPDSPRNELFAGLERLIFSDVRAEDGRLKVSPLIGDATELLPLGDGQFRGVEDAMATAAFVTSPDNELLLQRGMNTLQQIGPVKAYGRLLLLAYGLSLWLSSLLFALYWLGRRVRAKYRGAAIPHLRVRSLPALAATSLALIFGLIAAMSGLTSPADLAVPTGLTVGLWVASLLFPLMAGLALYAVLSTIGRRREVGTLVWHHSLHTALGLAVLAIFMLQFGWVGLRLWAF
ncbi:MAG: serine hydrolase domain-containing protein [Pseudomonadota bacterium]